MAPKLYIYLFFHYFFHPPTFHNCLYVLFPSFSLTIDQEVVDGSGVGKCLYNLFVPRCSRPEGFYHITGSLAPGVNNVEKWIQHFWTVFMGSCFSLLLFFFFIYKYIYTYTFYEKWALQDIQMCLREKFPLLNRYYAFGGCFFSIQHGNH